MSLVGPGDRRATFRDVAALADALLRSRTMSRYCLDDALLNEFSRSGAGVAALKQLYRLLLETLPGRIAAERIPGSIVELLVAESDRIRGGLDTLEPTFFDPANDAYLKDLAILLLTLLPCGAEYVQVQAGIPRSLLWRAGVWQAIRGLGFFALRAGGFQPYLSLHMDVRFREEFNPEGWYRTYLRIADLLRARPDLKGVFGTAWFYDPAMVRVSPHLVYLRAEREAAGAMTFCYGPSESALKNALARSDTRRRLHAEGAYTPKSHYIVWPRRDLIRWADAQGGGR